MLCFPAKMDLHGPVVCSFVTQRMFMLTGHFISIHHPNRSSSRGSRTYWSLSQPSWGSRWGTTWIGCQPNAGYTQTNNHLQSQLHAWTILSVPLTYEIGAIMFVHSWVNFGKSHFWKAEFILTEHTQAKLPLDLFNQEISYINPVMQNEVGQMI